MAKASIVITCEDCGKEFTHTKDCINRERAESYKEWAKDNIKMCPSCYRKMLEAAEAAEQEEALKGVELAPLEGSEKQIGWAIKIRRAALAMCMKYNPNEKFWALVNEKTSAKWWIENRDRFDSARIVVAIIAGQM